MARTVDRAREFDVRMAIGGSAGRIVRQLAAENLLLSTAGAAAGVLIAWLALHRLLPLAEGLPRVREIALDRGVFAFAALTAAATSLVVSLPTARRLTRGGGCQPNLNTARAVTAGRQRVRAATMIVQIAVSLVLLGAAAWMVTGLVRVMQRELGFEPRQLMAFDVSLPSVGYDADRWV